MTKESPTQQATPPPHESRQAAHEADPDAAGLPPHIVLPDRREFLRTQLRARMVLCFLGLLLVLGLWPFTPGYDAIFIVCASLIGLALAITGVRFCLAAKPPKA